MGSMYEGTCACGYSSGSDLSEGCGMAGGLGARRAAER